MAEINGFKLKAYKTFIGREGYGYSAKLTLNGKEVGLAADYANGGAVDLLWKGSEDETNILMSTMKEIADNAKSTLIGFEDTNSSMESILELLAELNQFEKIYIRQSKKKPDVDSFFILISGPTWMCSVMGDSPAIATIPAVNGLTQEKVISYYESIGEEITGCFQRKNAEKFKFTTAEYINIFQIPVKG